MSGARGGEGLKDRPKWAGTPALPAAGLAWGAPGDLAHWGLSAEVRLLPTLSAEFLESHWEFRDEESDGQY